MTINETKAIALSTILNQDDPEWTYRVQYTETACKVVVYDENDIFLGELAVVGNIGNELEVKSQIHKEPLTIRNNQ